jgi:hypothetical protein
MDSKKASDSNDVVAIVDGGKANETKSRIDGSVSIGGGVLGCRLTNRKIPVCRNEVRAFPIPQEGRQTTITRKALKTL